MQPHLKAITVLYFPSQLKYEWFLSILTWSHQKKRCVKATLNTQNFVEISDITSKENFLPMKKMKQRDIEKTKLWSIKWKVKYLNPWSSQKNDIHAQLHTQLWTCNFKHYFREFKYDQQVVFQPKKYKRWFSKPTENILVYTNV